MRAHRKTELRCGLMGRVLWAFAGAAWIGPSFAADVTPQRLLEADKEPQNWLMN